ncbi:hypothetical protein HYALB_00010395 [Hymenoscyphus albidus]|uniref:BTB domain-containing protein n=1 Tax=Hymenoscyphus albidus TaxID=595503 RepID=A0A9N9Q8Y3_9HELO|nr:hypothetical protein HYALB_00010395 [Hymenoscyphus albidus]
MLVSRQLSLSSRVFKSMHQYTSHEVKALRRNGSVKIPLPDDDPAAFTILMNIVHAKNKAISSQIDLPLVTQFTILVDKYEMHEAAGFIGEIDN